jgi:predicted glycoside hydrolase/deacetylase ChbG (UPF0249 family)
MNATMKRLLIPIIAIFLVSCEDYTVIRQELSKQLKLVQSTTRAIQHANSHHEIYAVLHSFNQEMEVLLEKASQAKPRTSTITSLMASPPRSLAKDAVELKKASAQLRETLAAASGYCEYALLRNMLVKTMTTLEKTLAQ